MKKIVLLFILFNFVSLSAQEVSDYPYIIIPKKFSDFNEGQYSLNGAARVLLLKKGYTVLPEAREYWADEAQQNPCMVLKLDVKKVKSFFKNKLKINFQDCNFQTIASIEKSSDIKEYKEGFLDALKKAISQIQEAKPMAYTPTESKKTVTIVTTETTKENLEGFPVKKETKTTVINNGEEETKTKVLASDWSSIKRVPLQNGEFKIEDTRNQGHYMQFYPTAKPGVYHVKLAFDGKTYFTIGFVDTSGYSYEEQVAPGKWKWQKLEITD